MARPVKKSGASRPGQDGSVETRNRVKTSVHLEPEIHKLLAIASIETGLDMSTIVNRLVKEKFGGWHIRKGRGEGRGEGLLQESLGQDELERAGEEAPEITSGARQSRKAASGSGKTGATREGQGFVVLTERSAHLDHDVAVGELGLIQEKVIDDFVGSEEAA